MRRLYRAVAPASWERSLTLVSLLLCMGIYISVAVRQPWGLPDSWSMWTLRAKMIAMQPDPADAWRDDDWPHLDYPPFLSALIGGVWRLTVADPSPVTLTPIVPIAVHGAIFAAILLIMAHPRGWRGWREVLIVGLAGVGYATWQYADTAQGLALLAALAAWRGSRWGWMGAALGAGLLIKNEGVMIAACAVVIAWTPSRGSGHSFLHRRMLRMTPGLAGGLAILVLWKSWIGVTNDVLGAPGMIERLTSLERWGEILPQLGAIAGRWRLGSLFVASISLIGLRGVRGIWWRGLAACGLIVVGYVLIYGITPHVIEWHIRTSWDRLLWQVFPAAVWALGNAGGGGKGGGDDQRDRG